LRKKSRKGGNILAHKKFENTSKAKPSKSRQNASLKWNEDKEAIIFISILIIAGIIAIVFRIGG